MARLLAELTETEFVVEMLTLQYIQGKAGDSAADYVELYKRTKMEVERAYQGSFDVRNLI